MNCSKLTVVCAAVPPPVQGHAVVTALIVRELNAQKSDMTRILFANLSPGELSKRKLAYHVNRIGKCLSAVALLGFVDRATQSTGYFVYESGWGIVYNFFLIGVARWRHFDLVLHHHTSAHTKRKQFRFAVLARLAGKSCTHIVLSDVMASDLCRQYGKLRVSVCRNTETALAATFSAKVQVKQFKCRLGMLSNLSAAKGALTAIKCLKSLRKNGVDAQLCLAGPIEDKAILHIVEATAVELPTRFVYLGEVHGNSKAEFFDSIDVFLFPSKYKNEAQPLVILEALANGIPVLAYKWGYIETMLPHDWTMDPRRHENYFASVERFCRNFTESFSSFNEARATAFRYFEAHDSKSRLELSNLLAKLSH